MWFGLVESGILFSEFDYRRWIEEGNDGNTNAMIELGKYFYEEGSDSERAFYWLQNAAGKGDVTGLCELSC